MLYFAHESLEYQNFLVSENRSSLISPQLYRRLISGKAKELNVLDFGCGLGYVSTILATHLAEPYHIYGCDYQEDLLDEFWKRIVRRELKSITPFFMPMRSRLLFPRWLPKMDHVIFSLSLSAVEDIFEVLKTIKSILKPEGRIHIIEWVDGAEEYLNKYFPKDQRLSPDKVRETLERTEFEIYENYSGLSNVYAISTRLKLHAGTD